MAEPLTKEASDKFKASADLIIAKMPANCRNEQAKLVERFVASLRRVEEERDVYKELADAILMGNTPGFIIEHLEAYREINAWWSAEHNYAEVIAALRKIPWHK